MIDFTKLPVAIPDLSKERRVTMVMGSISKIPKPYEDAYYSNVRGGKEQQDARTPEEISGMLNQWFFRGLTLIKFNMKPGAALCNDKEFGAFVRMILGSFEPKHEHKMMFLTWAIHVCCDYVTYQVKP